MTDIDNLTKDELDALEGIADSSSLTTVIRTKDLRHLIAMACATLNLASELEAARKVVAAGRNIHAALIGAYGECPFCERYRGIGLKPCYLQSELAAYERVMEEAATNG